MPTQFIYCVGTGLRKISRTAERGNSEWGESVSIFAHLCDCSLKYGADWNRQESQLVSKHVGAG